MFRYLLFLFLLFASLTGALKIVHPAQDETIPADFKYEIQWTVSLPSLPPLFASTTHSSPSSVAMGPS